MKLRIVHETDYSFSSEVFFEPHFLRFKPRNSPQIKVEKFNLNVVPSPVGISEHMDAENNLVHLCWFEDLYKSLHIKSETILQSLDYNPFNFIVQPAEFLKFPFAYDNELNEILQPALKTELLNPELIEFGNQIILKSNSNTIDFLTNLTRQIHSEFNLENRELGNPHKANKTFRLRTGSCRDFAWMQIMLLRYYGFATRFVSGYYFMNIANADFELHAWVEVFLPGAGWIGFDPSHGIIAGSTHIPIASSSFSENTMPVSGSVRGDAHSNLNTSLVIEILG